MKINIENSSEIERTLAKINGRATMYTFADSEDLCKIIFKVILDYGVDASNADGMTIVARSGKTMHGYDRPIIRNEVELTCEVGDDDSINWFMTKCERINGSWYVRNHVVNFAS